MAAPPTVAGTVILVRFPFSDLSRAKLRPAVVLATVGRGDSLLCQVTSNPYGDPSALELGESDFSAGGLRRTSYARPLKLFTAHESILERPVGRLEQAVHARIVTVIEGALRAELTHA